MYYDLAASIVRLPQNKSAMDLLTQHEFVWAEHGEELAQWATIASNTPGLEPVSAGMRGGETRYTYKGKSVNVPLEESRDDNLISVYTLSQLVKDDAELRMCTDTTGNSEQAFLVLPPAQWQRLEDACGKDAVSFRFFALPPSLEAFFEQAFADENMHRYDQG
ncbi:hypothetical protein F2P45_13875 [Massilia sp. CCM 8733]|uniref:Uncharacterized protein n=1 Tax=Massilia mucilaginosa TaxID=2609282 RepID=A0ABX0NTN8_9BURK|nr:hypothetical protein [Massilia mucilaginosa]NHZ90095.1 hypothetical protein [Massilia mucilaginosa]